MDEGGVKVFVKGEEASSHPMVIPGGDTGSEPMRKHLGTGSSSRGRDKETHKYARLFSYMRGVSLAADRVDLEVRVGYGQLHVFRFRNVPLL